MPNAASLRKRIDKLLTRLNDNDRTVYKRVVTKTGGDVLIGRPASVANVDTRIIPQPSIQYVGAASQLFAVGNVIAQIGDIVATVSADSMSLSDFQNPDMVMVFKGYSYDEEFGVVNYTPLSLGGEVIAFTALLRSKKRQ